MNLAKIYLLWDTNNPQINYIGSTIMTLRGRLRCHKSMARGGSNYKLYRQMRESGIDNFEIKKLANVNREKRFEYEDFYIKSIKPSLNAIGAIRQPNIERHRKEYEKHKEIILNRNANWRESNPEKIKQGCRNYYLTHREIIIHRSAVCREFKLYLQILL